MAYDNELRKVVEVSLKIHQVKQYLLQMNLFTIQIEMKSEHFFMQLHSFNLKDSVVSYLQLQIFLLLKEMMKVTDGWLGILLH